MRSREEQRIALVAPFVKITHAEEIVVFGVSEELCRAGIRPPLVGPAGLARAHQAERGGEECVQTPTAVSINGPEFRSVSGLCRRSRSGAGVRRCGRTQQYAMANGRCGEGEGQDGAVLQISSVPFVAGPAGRAENDGGVGLRMPEFMNATLLKTLVALVPACILLAGSVVLFSRTKSVGSLLQLVGAGCLMLVVLTHICEALHLFASKYWGLENTIGHYVDLLSAVLGLTFFPIGYLFSALKTRQS